MAPEQKSDIVCAFHGDLEEKLDRIENKVDAIKDKVSDLNLWRAKVIGITIGLVLAAEWAAKNIFR